MREVDPKQGEVVALNDPYAGGTHLPDVTLVMGVFARKDREKGRRGETGKEKKTGRGKGEKGRKRKRLGKSGKSYKQTKARTL